MASGKQSKRARKEAAAKAPPTSSKRGRRASGKVLWIVGGVIAIAAVAIGLGVGLSGGSSKSKSVPKRGSLVGALTGAADVEKLLHGIPQAGNVLGNAKAPTTMVEYIDLQCPHCQAFETQALPDIIKNYVRKGKTRLVMNMVAFIGPDSVRGRNGVNSAGLQGKAFNMTQILYYNQGPENSGWLNEQMVTDAAASIPGIDVPAVLAAQDTAAVKAKGTAMDAAASADGVQATPTILVGRTGQKPVVVNLQSDSDGASVAAAIDRALG